MLEPRAGTGTIAGTTTSHAPRRNRDCFPGAGTTTSHAPCRNRDCFAGTPGWNRDYRRDYHVPCPVLEPGLSLEPRAGTGTIAGTTTNDQITGIYINLGSNICTAPCTQYPVIQQLMPDTIGRGRRCRWWVSPAS